MAGGSRLIDVGVEALFVGTQCTACDPLHPLGCRRLDGELATAHFKLLEHRRELHRRLCGDMIAQPDQQLLGIGDRGLAEAEARADLGTETLGRAPSEEGFVRRRLWDVQLTAEGGDSLRRELRGVPWEPALVAEKSQQDGKAQPGRPALGHHERQLGRCQQPPIVDPARNPSRRLGLVATTVKTSLSVPASRSRSCA